jgi:hypothetical protein
MARHHSTPRDGGAQRAPEPLFPFLRDWHILAALALLTALFFRDVLLQKAFFWEDFLYQFYPFRNFATVSLASGEIPLWTPFVFMGMPFLADITGTVVYLPHLLLVPFVSGGKLSFWYVEVYQILHVYLAGVSMFALAKSFGLSRLEAGFAGFVYMLSGFMTVHAIHLVMICQAAWFPFAVLFFRKALKEHSLAAAVLAGGVMFLITCGGHIQITLYYFVFLFAYFLWDAAHELRARKDGSMMRLLAPRAGLAALMVIVAVGLSAVQLLPTAELTANSLREEMSYARSTDGQLSWAQLLTLVVPRFFGSSNALGGENPIMYWGPQAYWNYWETCTYIGLTAFILAVVAVRAYRSDGRVLFLAGFMLFGLLCALGDHFVFHPFLYTVVPGFNKFRVPGRWGFFVAFCGALLSGFGIRAMLSLTGSSRGIRTVILSAAGIVGLLTVCAVSGLLDPLINAVIQTGAWKGAAPPAELTAAARAIAVPQTLLALLFAAVAALLLVALRGNPRRAPLVLALLFVWQFIDISVFGFAQNNGKINPREYFDQQRPLIDRLVQEGKEAYFRVNARNPQGMIFDRNQGLIDRLYLTEGYTQLALKRRFPPASSPDAMYRLLNARYRLRTDTVFQEGRGRLRLRLAEDPLTLPRAYIVYRTHLASSEDSLSAFMSRPEFDPADVAAVEEPLTQPLDSTGVRGAGRATITRFTNNTMSLDVATPFRGLLVVSEMYFPGWNAYIDGVQAHVYRTDWSLRGVVVEQGSHTVELRYEPVSFAHGALISGATGIVSTLLLALSAWRRSRATLISANG